MFMSIKPKSTKMDADTTASLVQLAAFNYPPSLVDVV